AVRPRVHPAGAEVFQDPVLAVLPDPLSRLLVEAPGHLQLLLFDPRLTVGALVRDAQHPAEHAVSPRLELPVAVDAPPDLDDDLRLIRRPSRCGARGHRPRVRQAELVPPLLIPLA